MPSLILEATARALRPLLLLFSIFLLLRGHNEAGGGFVGGLVAASALVLDGISRSGTSYRDWRIPPKKILGLGLAISLSSGIVGLIQGKPFLSSAWHLTKLPVLGKPGTPLMFDVGVYFVVLGVTSTVLLALLED